MSKQIKKGILITVSILLFIATFWIIFAMVVETAAANDVSVFYIFNMIKSTGGILLWQHNPLMNILSIILALSAGICYANALKLKK